MDVRARCRGRLLSAGRFIVRAAALLVTAFRSVQAARRQPIARLSRKLEGGRSIGLLPLRHGVVAVYQYTLNEHWAKTFRFLAIGL